MGARIPGGSQNSNHREHEDGATRRDDRELPDPGESFFNDTATTEIYTIGTVLFSEEAIQKRVRELGSELTAEYGDKSPILVSILKGGFIFLADLVRAMDMHCEMDFMVVSSYEDKKESSGVVRILSDLGLNIEGRHVLIVEDIVDTGLTLDYLRELLNARNPASLGVVTLLDKVDRRLVEVPIEYTGFQVPDEFVVGYGLDYAQRYRNLPYITVLDEADLGPDGEPGER
jgi:hypoxanthine phosphoribosyltransferase